MNYVYNCIRLGLIVCLQILDIDQEPLELEFDLQQNDVDEDKTPALKRKIEDVEETTEAKKVCIDDKAENNEELTPKRKADDEEMSDSKKGHIDE